MTTRQKRMIWIISICICILLPAGVLLLTTGIHCATSDANSCTSVVFDKISLQNADRILVYDGDEVNIITDTDSIRSIAPHFIIAQQTNLADSYTDRYLEIYSGTKLLRTVHFSQDGTYAKIYNTDLTHWVFGSTNKAGQVPLSPTATESINAILEQAA